MKIGVIAPDWNWNFVEPYIQDWLVDNEVHRYKPRVDGAFERPMLRKFMDTIDICFVEWGLQHLVTITHLPNVKPTIVRIHRYDANHEHHRFVDWTKVKTIVFVADNVQQDFVNKHHPECKTEVITNSVDLELFRPNSARMLGVFGSTAGIVGSWTLNKGLHHVLNIVPKQPGWRLLMRIGGGPGSPMDTRYYQSVMTMITKLRDKVEMVPQLKHEQMPEFYNKCDVYMNFSQVESNSTSVIEAMACGCFPIIKSWIGAREQFLPESIVDNVGQAIQKLRWWDKLGNEEKIALSKKCRQFVEMQYDCKTKFVQMRKVLQEVLT